MRGRASRSQILQLIYKPIPSTFSDMQGYSRIREVGVQREAWQQETASVQAESEECRILYPRRQNMYIYIQYIYIYAPL